MENIRDFVPEKDTPELLTLLKEFQDHLTTVDRGNEVHKFNSDEDAQRYLDKMVDDVKEMNGALYVLEFENELVGFVQGIIDPRDDESDVMHQTTHNIHKEGWIGLIYVRPGFRGRHFGVKMVDAIKKYFADSGCVTMRLSVASDNENTVGFYRHYGFVDRNIEMALPL